MRAPHVMTAALALLVIGCARPVSAQRPAPARTVSGAQDRFRISVNGGVQLSSLSFDTSATKVVYIENGVIATSYRIGRGVDIDGGLSVRLVGGFGVGVAVSSATSKRDADVSAAIPNPFFFKMPRTITGVAPGQQRSELVTHVHGLYTLHPARSVDVALSAGPSFFHVRQDVVTDVSFVDTYPFDAPVFTAATSPRVTATDAVGFNAGADVGMRLARHAGLGASVRFSKASLSLTMPNSTNTVSMDVGGTQIAGGVRFWF
jgi:Outer membrane protein beta-barrel domain